MPELPEVRTVVNYLNINAAGAKIQQFKLFYNRLLVNLKDSKNVENDLKKIKNQLENQTINEVIPYGKYIIFVLDDYNMISHLRMEGKWIVEPTEMFTYGENILEAQFILDNNKALRYYDTRRFGTLDIVKIDTWKDQPAISKLGYEPFDKNATPEWLYNKIHKSKKPIKTALLDQTIILGLGNIYANEVLYEARIHPLEPCFKLTVKDCENILKASRDILKKSIEEGGTTIHSFASGNNHTGNYQKYLKVHGREGKKCFNCKTPIEKIFIGGRGTYFCPECQKLK